MKKKIVSLCAALALSASTVPAMAAEIPEKVEITFKVGDSILTVNGNPLEVTAPYVVGDGTTLVPVRVITEAFGAEVNWDGETQSVNLKYPDVDITIKIGSKSAQVNTHTEELLAAPELYQNTTMVPLRFISETFGAKVDYNEGLITVTKETSKETTSTVVGMTDKEYIGDSFYGWTMKNPKTLQMGDRSFDGTATYFIDNEDKNGVLIRVKTQEDDFDIDTEFNDIRNGVSRGTISIADKEQTSDGWTKIHFRSKDSDIELDMYEYIKGNKLYMVNVNADNESSMKQELFDIAASFSLNESRDFHDLSNVKDGARLFSDETYGISLNVPAGWTKRESTQPNQFIFYDPNPPHHSAQIEITSKSDTVSAQKLAENDRATRTAVVNPEMVTVSEVGSESMAGRTSYYYTAVYNGFGENKYYMKDSFIEIGNYVVNIAVYNTDSKAAGNVLSTLKVTEPDAEKVGNIIRSSDIGGTSTISLMDGKITVPSDWQQASVLPIIEDSRTGATIIASSVTAPSGNPSMKDILEESANRMEKSYDSLTKYGKVNTINKDGHTFYRQEFEEVKDDICSYFILYAVNIKGKIYLFEYGRYDIYRGGSIDTEAEEIITGFTVE